jgi:D-psicose/D-tagatose/L-ribulose 3-epimerase
MMTFGAHAFVWSAEWTEEGAERALRGAADRGLDFVEIPLPSDPTTFPLERTRELVSETGLAVTTSLGLPAERHMPGNPQGAPRQRRRRRG